MDSREINSPANGRFGVIDGLSVVHTGDVIEVCETLERIYLATELTVLREGALDAQLQALELPALTLGRLSFGAAVRTGVRDIGDYCVNIVLAGRAVNTWEGDAEVIVTRPGFAAVFAPGSAGAIAWSHDCSQLYLKVRPRNLHRELEMMLDRQIRSSLVFPSLLNVSTPTASTWLALVKMLAQDGVRPDGIFGHRLAVANVQHLLIQGLLLTQPHTFADEMMGRSSSSAGGKATKQAIDFMHAQPERAWTTGELAGEVGVSGRALQQAFSDSDELSPMTYLRQLRLHRVRAELSDEAAESATVAEVARRWGFVHLGRFAHQYRDLMGEMPSQTMRSTRRRHHVTTTSTETSASPRLAPVRPVEQRDPVSAPRAPSNQHGG
jgi:AraC-like DNA-binding protein